MFSIAFNGLIKMRFNAFYQVLNDSAAEME